MVNALRSDTVVVVRFLVVFASAFVPLFASLRCIFPPVTFFDPNDFFFFCLFVSF
jgi:hypothetical protein